MSYFEKVNVGNFPLDLFARLRVSQPFTVFSSKHDNDTRPLQFDEATFGTASTAHSAANARVRMTTNAANDAVIRQTFQRLYYLPGKSQFSMFTFVAPYTANSIKRIGLFETSNSASSTPQNGVFLNIDGDDSTIAFKIAKNGSITETAAQASWNIDPLNGSGTSGITLDFDRPQIMFIGFEWLGVGTVDVGFIIDKTLYLVHSFHHANTGAFDSVYMSTPTLPVCYYVQQTDAGTATLDHICSTVISEGGQEELGESKGAGNFSVIGMSSTSNIYALIGIRIGASYNATIIPKVASAGVSSTNKLVEMRLYLNPTVAGTFTYSARTNSVCEVAGGASTNTITGGEVLLVWHVNSGGALPIPIDVLPRLGRAIDGTQDTLVLASRPILANTDVVGALNWKELA